MTNTAGQKLEVGILLSIAGHQAEVLPKVAGHQAEEMINIVGHQVETLLERLLWIWMQ